MRAWIIALTAVGVMTSVANAAVECMPADKAGEIQQGRLLQKTIGGEKVYILQIPTAVCLTGRDPQDKVGGTRTVQVYSSDPKVDGAIRRYVGKDVQVTGRAFGAITQHHKAPIVMELSDIDRI